MRLCIHTELSAYLSDKPRSTRNPDLWLLLTWVFCLVPFMKTGSYITMSIEGKFISHVAIVTQDPFLNLPIFYEYTFCCIPRPLVPQAKELVSGHQSCVIPQSPSHRVTSRKESLALWSRNSWRKQSCVAIMGTWLAHVKRSPELENCHVTETLSRPPEHDNNDVDPRSQVGKALLHKDKPDSRHLLPWRWFHLCEQKRAEGDIGTENNGTYIHP